MENVPGSSPVAGRSRVSPTGLGDGPLSPLTLGLVSCGGAGALLFTAAYLIEGITRPGYDAWQQPISALSLGPGGWVQQVNFVVFGFLLVLSAVGWRRLLAPGRAAIGFPVFQGLAGLGLIVVGFFSQDPLPGYPPGAVATAPTAHGAIHGDVARLLIVFLACGCFAFAWRFAVESRWRGWAAYSAITGVVIIVFFWLFLGNATAPTAGLIERVSAGAHALWSCLLVATLYARIGNDERSAPAV